MVSVMDGIHGTAICVLEDSDGSPNVNLTSLGRLIKSFHLLDLFALGSDSPLCGP